MSGANSQPWEYIVVKDPKVKKDLFRCYSEDNTDFIYWMEQQRVFELRHPAYQMTADEAVERQRRGAGWSEAPALIVVVGDGRRQWGTVQGAHTFGRDQSHLTDGLANTCTFMHLAAVSLGLATQWVTIHVQEPFKKVLGVPDLMMLYLIIPIGYPAVSPELVVEVAFHGFTRNGTLRHAAYVGLREDKAPRDVRVRELSAWWLRRRAFGFSAVMHGAKERLANDVAFLVDEHGAMHLA